MRAGGNGEDNNRSRSPRLQKAVVASSSAVDSISVNSGAATPSKNEI
jgi:hypothetical protein